ncbi:serine/threonine-protein kinase Nek5-like [Cyprinus carpio]|uniref:non-specific serine/threonine protein kinase n=1 Tax=Cyprinus carpio TaxID=7962 RepID=A0A9Q9Z4F6_CYPCA|nr:serine/threonine-protein kinase Nek5-like [Cyprinus carpio]
MQQYHRLPGTSDDSDSSNMRIGQCKGVLEDRGYTIKKKLGQGLFGTVFLVNNTDEDPCAIKQMSSRDKNELDTMLKEVTNLKDLNHGYIVSYVDSFEDVKGGYFFIVMEYCEGGDLFKKMQTQKVNGIFKEQELESEDRMFSLSIFKGPSDRMFKHKFSGTKSKTFLHSLPDRKQH